LVDSLDIHDSSHNAKGPVGVSVIPCVFAIGGTLDRYNLKALYGLEFIRMVVLGYEMSYRIGEKLINS
jgi:2-methylcitrate dehydratase PrpD